MIWRGEFEELCNQMVQRKTAASFPEKNSEMLTGMGAYADLGQQILYDPAVYAQISAAACRT
ncbi:gag protein, partial [Escherichia coli]